jgi:ABC-type phosphate transport system auxiliary subunit
MRVNHLREQANRKAVMNGLQNQANQQTLAGIDNLQKHLADIESRLQTLPEESREQFREVFTKKALQEFTNSVN